MEDNRVDPVQIREREERKTALRPFIPSPCLKCRSEGNPCVHNSGFIMHSSHLTLESWPTSSSSSSLSLSLLCLGIIHILCMSKFKISNSWDLCFLTKFILRHHHPILHNSMWKSYVYPPLSWPPLNSDISIKLLSYRFSSPVSLYFITHCCTITIFVPFGSHVLESFPLARPGELKSEDPVKITLKVKRAFFCCFGLPIWSLPSSHLCLPSSPQYL